MKIQQKNLKVAICVLTALLIHLSAYSQTYQIADEYWEKAKNFKKQEKYLEAAQMYAKSAEAEQKCDEPRLTDLPIKLGEAGYCYDQIGQYDKAIGYFQQALVIDQKLEKDINIAMHLSNIGSVYDSRGQYDKAIGYFQQALEIDQKLGDERSTAIHLNNIGLVYDSWGQYDKAIEYYQRTLEIDKRIGDEIDIAIDFNNIGGIYDSWGQYAKAIEYYQQALEVFKKQGNQANIATLHNNIGKSYYNWKEYDKAIEHYQQALEIDKKLGREGDVAIELKNIGEVYYSWGEYDKAIANYNQALKINRKLGKEASTAIDLNNIGEVYSKWRKYDKAIAYFEESIALIEKIRLTASGEIRRDYLASQIDTYQALISTCINNKQPAKAFEVSEQSSAKYLAEQIVGSSKVTQVDLKTYREKLTKKTAVVKFANIAQDNSIRLVLNKENIYSLEVNDSSFAVAVTLKYQNEIYPKIIKGAVNFRGERGFKADTVQTNKAKFDNIINYYRSLLISPRKTEKEKETFKFISQQLYTFLFSDIEQYIQGKTELIILPDGILGFIPFETLILPDGHYMCEKYQIRYQQSLTVANQIAQRQTAKSGLLAIGGAVYNEKTYKSDMAITDDEIADLQKQTIVALNRGDNLDGIYDKLQRGSWNNLPGTKTEATAISLLNKNSKLITGKKANETLIKEMSKSGELNKYRILHFATHGTVVPEIPELSAVILSLGVDTLNDGYLRMSEIAELNIQPEFVNLSACETGLGRIYGGEGVVGLTQSWLIAGAKGLSVSLWQVDDTATKEFMISMYKKALEQNMPFSEAIYKTKMEFVNGKFGEQYKEPYFWAPFVYYGN